jgi:hypothetical protein
MIPDFIQERYRSAARRWRQRYPEEPPPLGDEAIAAGNVVRAMIARLNNRTPTVLKEGDVWRIPEKPPEASRPPQAAPVKGRH